jgi:hypothetical protein
MGCHRKAKRFLDEYATAAEGIEGSFATTGSAPSASPTTRTNGGDITVVRRMAGHEDVSTTRLQDRKNDVSTAASWRKW